MLDVHSLITDLRQQYARRYHRRFDLITPALRERIGPVFPGSLWFVTGPAIERSWVVDALTASAVVADEGTVVSQSELRTSDAIGWGVLVNAFDTRVPRRPSPREWGDLDLDELREKEPWGHLIVAGAETSRRVEFVEPEHYIPPSLLVADELASPPTTDAVSARRAWARSRQTTVVIGASAIATDAWDDAGAGDRWIRVERAEELPSRAQVSFGPPVPGRLPPLSISIPHPLRMQPAEEVRALVTHDDPTTYR